MAWIAPIYKPAERVTVLASGAGKSDRKLLNHDCAVDINERGDLPIGGFIKVVRRALDRYIKCRGSGGIIGRAILHDLEWRSVQSAVTGTK